MAFSVAPCGRAFEARSFLRFRLDLATARPAPKPKKISCFKNPLGSVQGFGGALKAMHRTWVAKEHRIAYKHSALEGDELELDTWLENIRAVQGMRKYELRSTTNRRLICEGHTTWVFVELETFQPKRIPKALVDAYREH